MQEGPLKVDRLGLAFHIHGIQFVITVLELNDGRRRVSNGIVVSGRKIFQGFHQTARHVTSFGGLDGSIDQTFTTRHGVEDKLRGLETRKETVAHESLRWRLTGILGEMGQRSVLETVLHTLSTNNLLTDESNHLRYVDTRTLRTRCSHDQRRVVLAELGNTLVSCLLTDLTENTRELIFHGLQLITTRILLQGSRFVLGDNLVTLRVRSFNQVMLRPNKFLARVDIGYTDGETHV